MFLIGIELGRINGIKSLFPGLLAVICFICVTPTTVEMLVDGEMHVVKDVLLRRVSIPAACSSACLSPSCRWRFTAGWKTAKG